MVLAELVHATADAGARTRALTAISMYDVLRDRCGSGRPDAAHEIARADGRWRFWSPRIA